MTAQHKLEENVSNFFSDFAEEWDSLYGGKRNLFWRFFDHSFRRDIYERYQITFERLGEDLRGKTILDIGCGSGVYCIEAAQRGAAKVIGVDVAPNMIELATAQSKKLGYSNVCEFVCTDFPPKVPVQALRQKFDYAIVMGVMDYVSDAGMFLQYLRPLIKEFVVLSFPGRHWLRAPVREYRYKLMGRCAIYTYKEQSIRDLCIKAGFRKVDILRLDHSGICYIVTAYT